MKCKKCGATQEHIYLRYKLTVNVDCAKFADKLLPNEMTKHIIGRSGVDLKTNGKPYYVCKECGSVWLKE